MVQPKRRVVAALLAFAGLIIPGLHKFYLGQPRWGMAYLLPGILFFGFDAGMIPRLASAMEGLWYLFQEQHQFDRFFNPELALTPLPTSSADPTRVDAIAQALRQLDGLRQEGLITEYEFEQQRRQLLS